MTAASDALTGANANAAITAINDLIALVNQVEAHTDKKITPDIAAQIIAWADQVIAALAG